MKRISTDQINEGSRRRDAYPAESGAHLFICII